MKKPFVLGLVVGIVSAAVVAAAPILPRKADIPDEVLCVANIDKVSIVVSPVPEDLRLAGVGQAELEQVLRNALRASKIEVVDDRSVTPRLVLHALTLNDPVVDDAVAVIFFLDVQQDVTISRLKRDLVVPTTTVLGAAQTTRNNLGRVARVQCENAVKQFLNIVQIASSRIQ